MITKMLTLVAFVASIGASAAGPSLEELQSRMQKIEAYRSQIFQSIRRSNVRLNSDSSPEVKEFLNHLFDGLRGKNSSAVLLVREGGGNVDDIRSRPRMDINSEELTRVIVDLEKSSKILSIADRNLLQKYFEQIYLEIEKTSRLIEALSWREKKLSLVAFAKSRLESVSKELSQSPVVVLTLRPNHITYRLLKMPVICEQSLGFWIWDSKKQRSLFLSTPYERDFNPHAGEAACVVLPSHITKFYRRTNEFFECYIPIEKDLRSALKQEFVFLGIEPASDRPGIHSRRVFDYEITQEFKEVGQYVFVSINGEKLIQNAAEAVAGTAENLN